MKVHSLFQHKTVFSFEVFPPRKTDENHKILNTLTELKGLQPDFISVTLGTGHDKLVSSTLEVAKIIQQNLAVPSIAHLPALYFRQHDVKDILLSLKQHNIKNILALRGDPREGESPQNDFHHASDLISFIKKEGDFSISAACYPECHAASQNTIEDIKHLKLKVDSGANHLISQLFFNNDYFYQFLEKCAIADINVPIQAGIMPVTNKKQIEKMIKMSNISLPTKFIKMMTRYEHNAEAMIDAGIAYAVNQIVDLVTQGVNGIHLYTMNNAYVAKRIYDSTKTLFKANACM